MGSKICLFLDEVYTIRIFYYDAISKRLWSMVVWHHFENTEIVYIGPLKIVCPRYIVSTEIEIPVINVPLMRTG